MGDMGDVFRAMQEERRTEKQEQLQMHTRRLRWMEREGTVRLRWLSRYHVRIWSARDPRFHMDFWPSTGKGRGRVHGARGGTTLGWVELIDALDLPDPFAESIP